MSFNLIDEIVENFSLELAYLKSLSVTERLIYLLADSSIPSEPIKKAPWATANLRSHMESPRVNDDEVRDLENAFVDAALSCGKSVRLVGRLKRIIKQPYVATVTKLSNEIYL